MGKQIVDAVWEAAEKRKTLVLAIVAVAAIGAALALAAMLACLISVGMQKRQLGELRARVQRVEARPQPADLREKLAQLDCVCMALLSDRPKREEVDGRFKDLGTRIDALEDSHVGVLGNRAKRLAQSHGFWDGARENQPLTTQHFKDLDLRVGALEQSNVGFVKDGKRIARAEGFWLLEPDGLTILRFDEAGCTVPAIVRRGQIQEKRAATPASVKKPRGPAKPSIPDREGPR